MNKLFVKPEIEIYEFAVADIVCASVPTEDEINMGEDNNNNHDFTWS